MHNTWFSTLVLSFSNNGNPAAHVAAANGNANILCTLVQSGANLEATDKIITNND